MLAWFQIKYQAIKNFYYWVDNIWTKTSSLTSTVNSTCKSIGVIFSLGATIVPPFKQRGQKKLSGQQLYMYKNQQFDLKKNIYYPLHCTVSQLSSKGIKRYWADNTWPQTDQPIRSTVKTAYRKFIGFMSFEYVTYKYMAFRVWAWPLLDKRSTSKKYSWGWPIQCINWLHNVSVTWYSYIIP